MLYFIPAWYLKNEWKEDEQFWYRRRMKTETDDTVKQIQLFQLAQGYRIYLHALFYYRYAESGKVCPDRVWGIRKSYTGKFISEWADQPKEYL